jgi:hypothetical protein
MPRSQKAIKSEAAHTQQRGNIGTSDSVKPPTSEKRKLPQPKSDKAPAKVTDKSPAKSYEILTASETWSLAESIDRYSLLASQSYHC